MHGSIISNVISGYTGGLAGSTNKAPQDVTAPNLGIDDSAVAPNLLAAPTPLPESDVDATDKQNTYTPPDGKDWSHDDYVASLKDSPDFKAHFASQDTPTVADSSPWSKPSTYTPQGLVSQGLKSLGSTGTLSGDLTKLFTPSSDGATAGGEF